MNKSRLLTKVFGISPFCRFINVSKQCNNLAYCKDLVRTHDYENYLCSLLLPINLRTVAIGIRAFNVEVARIEDHVKNNEIAKARLMFWIDALDKIYNNQPPEQPVCWQLCKILKKHKLSKRYFKRLIDARVEKLKSNSTFMNLQSIEQYAEYTVSSIYYLILEGYGIQNVNTDHIASHLGKAQGIVTLIRSIPHNMQRRILMLPQDILLKNGVTIETVVQGKSNVGLQDTVFEVAQCAKQHLDKVESLKHKVDNRIYILFLSTLSINSYLEELQVVDFDVFHPKLQKRNNFYPVKLLWKKFQLNFKS